MLELTARTERMAETGDTVLELCLAERTSSRNSQLRDNQLEFQYSSFQFFGNAAKHMKFGVVGQDYLSQPMHLLLVQPLTFISTCSTE